MVRIADNSTHRTRRGFSFIEILFAVMVLGIGFIMIAAIFPVALKQTQSTTEETVAATVAKGAVSYLAPYSSLMSNDDNKVHVISPIATDPIGSKVAGSVILASDSRYAWAAMYRRGTTGTPPAAAPYAQVIVIALQAHNRTNYDGADLVARSGGPSTLEARPIQAGFTYTPGPVPPAQPDQITFDPANVVSSAVGEGSFVVIADDGQANPTLSSNGFVYRVGNLINGTTWQLMPGNDTTGSNVKPTAGNLNTSVLVIGRGYDDATATTYSGPVQDAAVYTTFITP